MIHLANINGTQRATILKIVVAVGSSVRRLGNNVPHNRHCADERTDDGKLIGKSDADHSRDTRLPTGRKQTIFATTDS
ncbi:hypothetical protein [Allorhodopirellula heiligendammensis]|nr:hypothetical protein [Allorhodopirellula heiligendammensis]